MVGRQLPFFSLLVPFWLIWAFAGPQGNDGDLAGDPGLGGQLRGSAVPRVSNYIGPELVDVIAAISSMVCLVLFLRVWKPKTIWTTTSLKRDRKEDRSRPPRGDGRVACWRRQANPPPLAPAGALRDSA